MGDGLVLDLFAGPGGWSEGLRLLGMTDVGIEWDEAACETRAAAGHRTIRADVASYPTAPFVGKVAGLIASPPCQDFSLAGKRAGRSGEKGQLIDDVPRWVEDLRPEWFACEQVPPALEVWEEFAWRFRELGYSTWAGVLNAADFGVPQTRKRAFLIGSRVRPAVPPVPTHAKVPQSGLFGAELPWVSMADALGWGMSARPCTTLVAGSNRGGGTAPLDGGSGARRTLQAAREAGAWVVDRRTNSKAAGGRMEPTVPVSMDRPAPALTGKAGGQWVFREAQAHGARRTVDEPAMTISASADNGNFAWVYEQPATTTTDQVQSGDYEGTEPIKLTVREALILQSFRPDYPVQGNRTKQYEQIGNAVPPLLAAHVVAAIAGVTLRTEDAA